MVPTYHRQTPRTNNLRKKSKTNNESNKTITA